MCVCECICLLITNGCFGYKIRPPSLFTRCNNHFCRLRILLPSWCHTIDLASSRSFLEPCQITKFMGPTWGPSGSCRPQMGPMLAPWILLSGMLFWTAEHVRVRYQIWPDIRHPYGDMMRSDIFMMTSSNGTIFRVTGHLCGEFTGPRWIPSTKASDAELWCFLWSASE